MSCHAWQESRFPLSFGHGSILDNTTFPAAILSATKDQYWFVSRDLGSKIDTHTHTLWPFGGSNSKLPKVHDLFPTACVSSTQKCRISPGPLPTAAAPFAQHVVFLCWAHVGVPFQRGMWIVKFVGSSNLKNIARNIYRQIYLQFGDNLDNYQDSHCWRWTVHFQR